MNRVLIIIITTAALLAATPAAQAAVYYVDYQNGSDSNDGVSPSSAWKHAPGDSNATAIPASIGQGNSILPGTVLKFKGSVVYKGAVQWGSKYFFGQNSPVVNGSPGAYITISGDTWPGLEGVKAIIDGSQPITNWSKCGSPAECGNNSNWQNIYYAYINKPAFLDLAPALFLNAFQDGMPLVAAQYPNALNPRYPMINNFLSVPLARVTTTSVQDGRFAQFGQELVGKYLYLWIYANEIAVRKILSFNETTNTITFESANVYTSSYDTKYAIANMINSAVLDTPGEYYLDENPETDGTFKLYLWPINNQDLRSSGNVIFSNQVYGFRIWYPKYIVLEGFAIQYLTGDSFCQGASGVKCEGIAIDNSGSSHSSDFVIRDNEIKDVSSGGGAVVSVFNVDNLFIENNYIHDCGGDGRGIQSGGALGGNTLNVIYRGNTLSNIGRTNLYMPQCSNCQILNNTVLDSNGTHGNGISVYQGSNNVLVAGNKVINSNYAVTIQASSNVSFVNNIFDGSGINGYVLIDMGGMTGVNNIFNNLIIRSSSKHALLLFSSGATFNVKNNIIDGTGKIGTYSYNIYTSRGWDQLSNSVGEFDISNLDRLLNNYQSGDYTPPASSPAIDKGVDLSASGGSPSDIIGTLRPQGSAWDIGAYEYVLDNADISADGSVTAYDAALALQLERGELEAALIAQQAVML